MKLFFRQISKTFNQFTTANQVNQFSGYLFIVIAVSFGLATKASALNWEDNYGAGVSAGYDDNFFLTSSDEVDTTFTSLSVFAGAIGQSETTNVIVSAGLTGNIYSDSSIDDRTNADLLFSISEQNSERLLLNLEVSHQRESSIETELLDSGLIVDGTRDRFEVAPGMQYQIDVTNLLEVELSLVDVSYDTVPLEEYQDNSILLGWKHQLDETRSLSTRLILSKLKPEETEDTDATTIDLDYEMKQSEATTYNFLFGLTNVDGPSGSEDGSSYGLRINHAQDQNNNIVFSLTRSYEPSGLGVVREEDRINLEWLRGYSERLQGSFLAGFVGTEDRDYFELQPGLLYRLSENTFVSGYYRYRRQDGTGIDANSNSLFFSFSYSE